MCRLDKVVNASNMSMIETYYSNTQCEKEMVSLKFFKGNVIEFVFWDTYWCINSLGLHVDLGFWGLDLKLVSSSVSSVFFTAVVIAISYFDFESQETIMQRRVQVSLFPQLCLAAERETEPYYRHNMRVCVCRGLVLFARVNRYTESVGWYMVT